MQFHGNQLSKYVFTDPISDTNSVKHFESQGETHSVKKKKKKKCMLKTTDFEKNTGLGVRRADFGMSLTVSWLCDLE